MYNAPKAVQRDLARAGKCGMLPIPYRAGAVVRAEASSQSATNHLLRSHHFGRSLANFGYPQQIHLG
ncbi:hypothetical protein ACTXT7_007206 [Hymenolepis weldensis]